MWLYMPDDQTPAHLFRLISGLTGFPGVAPTSLCTCCSLWQNHLLASDLRTSAHPVCPAASLLRDQGLAGARSGAPHMLFFSPEVFLDGPFLAGKFYTLSVTHMHTILAHLGGQ